MQVEQIPVGSFEMNCYIISTNDKKGCLIIDPGDEPQRIISYIQTQDLKPDRILLTHCHIDHARRASEVQQHFKIPLYMGEADVPLLESLNEQAALFGMEKTELPNIDGFFRDREQFSIAGLECTVLHTPGHSPGSFCIQINGSVFVGDVLFLDSIGRTDLYGGSYPVLMQSIQEKLLILPDETIVYPGHGPSTSVGREKEHNPFLNPDRLAFS